MRKITNREWDTLAPAVRWSELRTVKGVLEGQRWFIAGINGAQIRLDPDTIDFLKRINAYLMRVIEMLEGEKASVRGTKPLARWECTKHWVSYLREIVRMDLEGKFSPEARPFIARKLREISVHLTHTDLYAK